MHEWQSGAEGSRTLDLLNAMAFPGRRSCSPMHTTARDSAALRVIADGQWWAWLSTANTPTR